VKQASDEMRPLARLMAWVIAAVGAAAVVGTTPAAASAEPGHDATPASERVVARTVFNNELGGDARTTIADEYRKTRADRSRGNDLKQNLIKQSRARGLYLDSANVDYIRLERGEKLRHNVVELATVRNYKVKEVTVTDLFIADGEGREKPAVGVDVQGEAADDQVRYPDGPAFGEWDISGSGQYIVRITGVGEQLSVWQKYKMLSDGNPAANYVAYKRKATGAPYEITGPNYVINNMGIKAYPTHNYIVNHWVDWAPAQTTHTGNCDQVPLTLSVDYAGVGLSTSFLDCDRFTAHLGSPGDMSVGYEEGALGNRTSGGNKEIAFEFIVGIDPNYTAETFHDFQRIQFFMNLLPAASWYSSNCQATDSDATCS
jgi:hypothetical protein